MAWNSELDFRISRIKNPEDQKEIHLNSMQLYIASGYYCCKYYICLQICLYKIYILFDNFKCLKGCDEHNPKALLLYSEWGKSCSDGRLTFSKVCFSRTISFWCFKCTEAFLHTNAGISIVMAKYPFKNEKANHESLAIYQFPD